MINGNGNGMYGKLVGDLIKAGKISEGLSVLLPNSGGSEIARLMLEAADAIETLYEMYKDAFAVIATAWRDNPKDITLSAYMMKHACCCDGVSKEERERELCRSNYAAQLEGLGYNADGTPKCSE